MFLLKELGNVLKTPDQRALEDSTRAVEIMNISPEVKQRLGILQTEAFTFVNKLSGENGSPLLLEANGKNTQAVLKTYEPTIDFYSGYPISNVDRVEILREEVAAFCLAESLQLAQVPPTILRKITPETKKEWNIPNKSRPDLAIPIEQAVMLQTFVSDVQTFNNVNEPLPNLVDNATIFKFLLFDYLVAYGDGRYLNLLVGKHTIWPIDHGRSFRLSGSIRNTDLLGIPDDFTLANTQSLQAQMQTNSTQSFTMGMELLLGKKKAQGVTQRLQSVHEVLATHTSISVGTLKQTLNTGK